MREKINFNSDWKFKAGDEHLTPPPLKDVVYREAKTQRCHRGYASPTYGNNAEMDFENWQNVTLPHDFIITQEPQPQFNNTLGYFDYHNGWYRKTFRVEEADRNKRISVYFEGVATYATVYLNGCLMYRNFCGYTSFEVDLTDMVKFNDKNVLAVYVNTTDKHEGWWYSGGGIFRPVWLIKTDLVSVDLYGAYVHPEKQEDTWNIPVDVTLRNDDDCTRRVCVQAEIMDGEQTVAQTECTEIEIPSRGKKEVHLSTALADPKLWDCENPNLYGAVVHIYDTDTEIDTYQTRFGFRTLRFDPDHGFFLNGKHTIIKGVCCHEDYGLQGKAIADSVKRLRLEKLREMGANGYRTSHYPQSEYTFDCLAEMGFLVMAETRWFESTKDGLDQFAMMVKCHRNNPAIIMWSIGNEEMYHFYPMGKRIFVSLREHVKQFDATRPFTAAVDKDPANAAVMDVVDIIGINYNLSAYDAVREKYPNKMVIASECCAVPSTRGWHLDDCTQRGYFHCYDNRGANSREGTWKFLREREWVAGCYQWAGIEHRGETMWPRLCSVSGAHDLFLQRKEGFYINKAHWSEEPMVHIYPHWNLEGHEGEVVKVWIYTNCDTVELKQDGKTLDKVSVEQYGHAEFEVVYHPGKLEAIGYQKGNMVCSDVVETTGEPVALELELQNKHELHAKETAVFNCYAVDAQGRRIPNAQPLVQFDSNVAGKIVGTGSAITDHVPVQSLDRKMYGGVIAICAMLGKEGTFKLYAKSEGLKAARYEVTIKE